MEMQELLKMKFFSSDDINRPWIDAFDDFADVGRPSFFYSSSLPSWPLNGQSQMCQQTLPVSLFFDVNQSHSSYVKGNQIVFLFLLQSYFWTEMSFKWNNQRHLVVKTAKQKRNFYSINHLSISVLGRKKQSKLQRKLSLLCGGYAVKREGKKMFDGYDGKC